MIIPCELESYNIFIKKYPSTVFSVQIQICEILYILIKVHATIFSEFTSLHLICFSRKSFANRRINKSKLNYRAKLHLAATSIDVVTTPKKCKIIFFMVLRYGKNICINNIIVSMLLPLQLFCM